MAIETLEPYQVAPTERLASILPGNPPETGTKAFRGLSASGKTYWIKVPNNPQGSRVLATEQIVTAVGGLIDAPVRETALIEISSDWDGWPITDGFSLRKCVAHASLELSGSEESRDQAYIRNDDNARRWARWIALWDWCFGSDEQWLYEHEADKSMWSFDHNMWFLDSGNWGAEQCNGGTTGEWLWRGEWKGIDSDEILRVADLISKIARSQIQAACYSIPAEWGVPLNDLDALTEMLLQRRVGVADRLRVNVGRAR